ncbi:MAG: helix-hairpin-helix domain-containing protein [Chlorobiaceae bacterium]
MKRFDNLSRKLGITRAEITLVSALLGFLVLGGILKSFRSSEEASLLLKKAESARYREAEVDSLIKLAAADQATVKEEMAEEQSGGAGVRRGPHIAEKKQFNGTLAFNRATTAELQKIPGIGPVMAAKLVGFRTSKGGRIRDFEEFLEIPGVGRKKLELLKKHFTLE